mgnify:CR=1 FL=1
MTFETGLRGENEFFRLVFQIRRLANGKISSALGTSITAGHRARITGPFGNAFLRHQETGPIVLASSGTGFAPIWSLVKAVKRAQPNRIVKVVTGIREPRDLYMAPAIRWLQDHGTKDIVVTAKRGAKGSILKGTADHHLPEMHPEMTVHVAGNPHLVERTKAVALAANATCYADPFTASSGKLGMMDKTSRFFRSFRR